MADLTRVLSEKLGAAFSDMDLDPALGVVRLSDRPDLAQFQCNGAMAAAKIAKQNPRAIAEQIKANIEGDPIFAKVELAGPGFINLDLTDFYLNDAIGAATDDRLGIAGQTSPRTVMIDFGGPNVAKPMHVGHLRSSIIGDSLQRLFRHLGDQVISDVHLGDWGLQMGQVLYGLAHPELTGVDLQGREPTLEDLEKIYPAVSNKSKEDEAVLAECREITAKLQAREEPFFSQWNRVRAVSIDAVKKGFMLMGVTFDEWKGEYDADSYIPNMVADMQDRHIANESDGAWVIPVATDDDKSEIPPLILLKSDGASMYSTTDLGTIIDRVESHDPDLILYVVDQRQHLHFEQVFRAARKAGINGKAEMEHIGFGTMNGTDGKPFKTREGGVMKLQDLITMGRKAALEKIEEAGIGSDYTEEEKASIANKVGLAAIKFADLSNHRISNYVFDLDRFMSFEGKTGPYLQYAAVRIKSILARAVEAGRDVDGPINIKTEEERRLVLALLGLEDALMGAYVKRAPNILCDYVYGIAQSFSSFYAACPVVKEDDEATRASRLGLCRLTLRQIELVLDLLGIEIPERM